MATAESHQVLHGRLRRGHPDPPENGAQPTQATNIATRIAVKRHGQVVHEVVKTCGPGTGGSQIYMHNPTLNRNAGACFVQGQWWIVIDGEPMDGDNIVSIFPRRAALSIDDVIAYLKAAGYQ